jgi:hypothetical protein
MLIATSPNRYNSVQQSSPISPISAPANAGSCPAAQAAFAAVAAAEAAVATALQASGRTLQLSEADLFYCSQFPASLHLQETCRTGAGFDGSARPFLQALVDRQQQLKLRQCLSFTPALAAEQVENLCAGSAAAASSSSSSGEQQGSNKCSTSSPLLAKGGLSFKPITEIWEAQVSCVYMSINRVHMWLCQHIMVNGAHQLVHVKTMRSLLLWMAATGGATWNCIIINSSTGGGDSSALRSWDWC